MATEPVLVIGVGMMTAVGLTAAETAASVRAGTARFTETPLCDKRYRPFTLGEVPDDGLPPLADAVSGTPGLTTREMRLLRLATAPLLESLAPVRGRVGPVGLCLALPEVETGRPLDRGVFLGRLATQVGDAIDPTRSNASHTGRAGGLLAIGQAVAAVRSGVADLLLAGAIDSYRDPQLLGALDQKQRVKSDSNWDGFIPGEGAAFVLLASQRAADAVQVRALARVSPAATAFEPGHLESTEPYRGDGLAATFKQLAAAGLVESPIAEVYSSMNGESYWAKEWGVGYIRNRALFREGHGLHHPADCFGDTGAACGPLFVALAAIGIGRGYRRAPALIYGSSDRGPRSAVVVSAAGQ